MAYTNIDDPSAHFQTFLYTGNGSSRSITLGGNSDLQPDLYWYKARNTNHHYWVDSSRGTTKYIYSSLTSAEATVASAYLTAFDSNGVSLGGGDSGTNTSGISFANWAWKANGGTTSSNTDGSITSTVQANQDAGFSIVQYTGTGTAATIGHGLGVAPAMYIVKNRDQAGTSWTVFHKDLTSNAYSLYLSDTTAQSNAVGYWNGTSPTSTVFSIKNTSGDVNTNTEDYVVYCFAEKQGYSKFGKYVGNGNANGPFIYTGFKPAFFLLKKTSAADGWRLFDNKRAGYNDDNYRLAPNDNTGEDTATTYLDILSNGVKIRGTAGSFNQSGGTYIYMAFAENPFTTSTGIPTTAR